MILNMCQLAAFFHNEPLCLGIVQFLLVIVFFPLLLNMLLCIHSRPSFVFLWCKTKLVSLLRFVYHTVLDTHGR